MEKTELAPEYCPLGVVRTRDLPWTLSTLIGVIQPFVPKFGLLTFLSLTGSLFACSWCRMSTHTYGCYFGMLVACGCQPVVESMPLFAEVWEEALVLHIRFQMTRQGIHTSVWNLHSSFTSNLPCTLTIAMSPLSVVTIQTRCPAPLSDLEHFSSFSVSLRSSAVVSLLRDRISRQSLSVWAGRQADRWPVRTRSCFVSGRSAVHRLSSRGESVGRHL